MRDLRTFAEEEEGTLDGRKEKSQAEMEVMKGVRSTFTSLNALSGQRLPNWFWRARNVGPPRGERH